MEQMKLELSFPNTIDNLNGHWINGQVLMNIMDILHTKRFI